MTTADHKTKDYEYLFHVAGSYCGKEWLNKRATVRQIDRIQRSYDKYRKLKDSAPSLDEAMAAVVRIIMPTRATDAESIKKCWEELRGRIAYPDRAPFVVGFLEGAIHAASEHIMLLRFDDWVRSFSSQQLVKLAEFVGQHADDEEVGGQGWYPDGCNNAYQLVYFATHGHVPFGMDVARGWFLDSFEHAEPDCYSSECVEGLFFHVIRGIRAGAFEDEIKRAYRTVYDT